MQKKIVRIITFSNYLAHTEPLFKDLQILPIEKLYFNRIGLFMYKYTNGILPVVMNELYIKNNEIHSHNTRSSQQYHITSGTEIFSSISARIWNVLSLKMDINISLPKFKVLSKSYLLHNSISIKYTK